MRRWMKSPSSKHDVRYVLQPLLTGEEIDFKTVLVFSLAGLAFCVYLVDCLHGSGIHDGLLSIWWLIS